MRWCSPATTFHDLGDGHGFADGPPHAFQGHGPGAALLEQGHRVAQVALDRSLIGERTLIGLGRRIISVAGHQAVFTAVALRGRGGGRDRRHRRDQSCHSGRRVRGLIRRLPGDL